MIENRFVYNLLIHISVFLNHSNKFEILATHFYHSPFDGTKKQSFLSRIIIFKLFFIYFLKYELLKIL